ncbi:MAG: hypothetical protein ACLUUO_14095 [Sellimonas intestinalis]
MTPGQALVLYGDGYILGGRTRSFDPKRRTIMIKADYHMHTYFSSDSDTPPGLW